MKVTFEVEPEELIKLHGGILDNFMRHATPEQVAAFHAAVLENTTKVLTATWINATSKAVTDSYKPYLQLFFPGLKA